MKNSKFKVGSNNLDETYATELGAWIVKYAIKALMFVGYGITITIAGFLSGIGMAYAFYLVAKWAGLLEV